MILHFAAGGLEVTSQQSCRAARELATSSLIANRGQRSRREEQYRKTASPRRAIQPWLSHNRTKNPGMLCLQRHAKAAAAFKVILPKLRHTLAATTNARFSCRHVTQSSAMSPHQKGASRVMFASPANPVLRLAHAMKKRRLLANVIKLRSAHSISLRHDGALPG